MTKQDWIRRIPRAEVLTLGSALNAADALLSAVENRIGSDPQLFETAQRLGSLAAGLERNLNSSSLDRFHPRAMANLRELLIDRGTALFDELERAEFGVGVGAGGDHWVWGPPAVTAELKRVKGVFDTINAEGFKAKAEGKITQEEFDTWTSNVYKPAIAFLTSASSLWGSNAVAAQDYEQNAGTWRAFFKARGATMLGPENLVRKPPESDLLWPLLALGVGIVLGVFGSSRKG